MGFGTLYGQATLDKAVGECWRLLPLLVRLTCGALKSLRYDNVMVPACTVAMVSHCPSHLFANPEVFHPDWFSSPASGSKHRCSLACKQFKATWAVLLDRFSPYSEASFPEPDYGSRVTSPDSSCCMRYRRVLRPSLLS